MKRITALLLFLLCGCTSVLLDHGGLLNIHFTEGDAPGQYIVSFRNMLSAWPTVDYRLKVQDIGTNKVYVLRVYGDLVRKAPRPGVTDNRFTELNSGYDQIRISMPTFKLDSDQLLIVDDSGTHPVPFWTLSAEERQMQKEAKQLEEFLKGSRRQ